MILETMNRTRYGNVSMESGLRGRNNKQGKIGADDMMKSSQWSPA